MKIFKLLVVLLLVLVFACSSMGCSNKSADTISNKTNETDETDKIKSVEQSKEEEVKVEEGKKLKNPNVSMQVWFEPNEEWLDWVKKFEEEYSAKVDIRRVGWNELASGEKLASEVAAGDPTDITYLYGPFYPSFVIQNLLSPIDEYVDFEDPVWDTEKMEYFNWKDRHYGLCTLRSCDISLIFYNKTIFEENGLDTPTQLYEEGNWNWSSFLDCAKELTQDTDGDGNIDLWGAGLKPDYHFYVSNDTDLVNFENDGRITLNFDDPNVVDGFEYMQNLFCKSKAVSKDSYEMTDFIQRKIAMIMSSPWGVSTIKENEMKDDWGFVPFPFGPNNDQHLSPTVPNSLALSNGTKNPKGAVEFVKWMFENNLTHDNNYYSGDIFTKDQFALLDELFKKTRGVHSHSCINVWPIYDPIAEGAPISTILDKEKPNCLASIEDKLSQYEIVVNPDAFEGMDKLDFENNNVEPFINSETAKLSITNDKNEIINGKSSLKIEVPESEDWIYVANIPNENIKIVPGHTYNVSFDYKILNNDNKNAKYGFEFLDDKGKSYGWNEINQENKLEGKCEKEIKVYKECEGLYINFKSNNGDKIILDDFIITSDN